MRGGRSHADSAKAQGGFSASKAENMRGNLALSGYCFAFKLCCLFCCKRPNTSMLLPALITVTAVFKLCCPSPGLIVAGALQSFVTAQSVGAVHGQNSA